MTRLTLGLLLAAAIGVAPVSVAAARDGDHAHERARQALQRGEILPLARILAIVAQTTPGDILAIELEYRRERPIYEVRVLGADGRVREIDVDARTGEVVTRSR